MPQAPNKVLRIVVPLVLLLGGIGVSIAVFLNTGKQQQGEEAKQAAATPGQPAAPSPTPGAQPPTGTTSPGVPTAAKPPSPEKGAEVVKPAPGRELVAVAAPAADWQPLGALDDGGKSEMQLRFSARGAGVASLELAHHFVSVARDEHVKLQAEQVGINGGVRTPMALLGVEIDGVYVDLTTAGEGKPAWTQRAPGSFEAVIADKATGAPVVKVTRSYELTDGSYAVRVKQAITSLDGLAHTARWFQVGPVDLPKGTVSYGGDTRRVRFGYVLPANQDPKQNFVLSSDHTYTHDQAYSSIVDAAGKPTLAGPMWPNAVSTKGAQDLVWAGMNNRYFGVVVMPLVAGPAGTSPVFKQVESVDRLAVAMASPEDATKLDYGVALRFNGRQEVVPAGGSLDFSLGLFAGPQSRPMLRKDPVTSAAGVDKLVVYQFPAGCCPCAIGWVTDLIHDLLLWFHDHVTGDYALAIVVLVLVVRSCLHPVTKWSQIRMQRFGKQMQAIGPKMTKLKERYANDSVKLQQETTALWREEGVSPAGLLGCLPIFLQMPVWLGVSSSLFFSVELRHEPAFYGMFQKLGTMFGSTQFLADLSEPDRLLYWGGKGFHLPLMGDVNSFNLLPLFLGLVFFLQQKYTPQTTTATTPEQEMQMKMMKWMSVLLFPVMMYNAPSGLAIYFITNSTLAILESKWIKRHIETHDLLNLEKLKANRKPGFIARVQAAALERQRKMEQQAKRRK